MNIAAIRTWHWMIVGLSIGALYGCVREASTNFHDELASYGTRRIGQREFEQALTKKFLGKPCLTDLVISTHRLSRTGAPTVTLHVASGLYCDGRTHEENGRVVARWEPAYFVASVPYIPVNPHAGKSGKAPGTQFENVVAYLTSVRLPEPVPFRYSRWWWATRPLFLWTGAGFGFIGVVWPAIVNVLTFGTLLRPPEARGLSLWKTRSKPVAAATQPVATDIDPAVLEALERGLAADATDAPRDVTPVAAPAALIRQLRGAEPEPAAVVAEQRKKDFGADKEDFYPTELRVKPGN